MALIYQGTTTSTGKIRVAKNCGSLVLVTSGDVNFATATISAYIERSSSNEEICTDVPFLDFLILNKVGETIRNFQTDHLSAGKRFRSIEFDLGSDAGLLIEGTDVLVFELKSLGATYDKKIYALDDLEHSNSYRRHEYKNMLADEKVRTFQVGGSEFCLISSNVDKIRSIVMRTRTGERMEFVEDELRHMMSTLMPDIGLREVTVSTSPLGLPDYPADSLLIPTFDILEIEIHRSTSGVIPVHFQYDVAYPVAGRGVAIGKPNMSKGILTADVLSKSARRG